MTSWPVDSTQLDCISILNNPYKLHKQPWEKTQSESKKNSDNAFSITGEQNLSQHQDSFPQVSFLQIQRPYALSTFVSDLFKDTHIAKAFRDTKLSLPLMAGLFSARVTKIHKKQEGLLHIILACQFCLPEAHGPKAMM